MFAKVDLVNRIKLNNVMACKYRVKTKNYQFTCDEPETNEQAALGHQSRVRMSIVEKDFGEAGHDNANGD